MSPRRVDARYEDPLDRIWIATAARLGLTVERSGEVYAATDGAGRLLLGAGATLDADDCVAQMIFHELCHALVQDDDAFARRDWGLDNRTDADAPRERACLLLQACLAQRHGLRAFLAPTTDYRAFWDALPIDPLAGAEEVPAALARRGLERATAPPFAPHLDDALTATAAIVALARPFPTGGATLYDRR